MCNAPRTPPSALLQFLFVASLRNAPICLPAQNTGMPILKQATPWTRALKVEHGYLRLGIECTHAPLEVFSIQGRAGVYRALESVI